jgi:deoxyadenosine/deoxycytidine kinase
MIIWIDGANGVGKSHVAAELAECLVDRNADYVESDLYWNAFIQNDFFKALLEFNPYRNKYFLGILRNTLEKILDCGKMPIVSMSLVDKLCEKELLEYFEKKKISMLHIILEAEKGTITHRIENDPIRDENLRNQQKLNVPWQIQYLETEYPNAIRINTEGKNLDEIIGKIIALL